MRWRCVDVGIASCQLVDVRAAVNTIANTFRALAFSKKLGYHILVDPKMPTHVMTDDTRLQQILGNLIGECPVLPSVASGGPS